MKKRNLLIVMLALVMCFSSSVAMAYDSDLPYGASGTFNVKGQITSSYTFNASTKHDTNYVYVFARTYANALDDEGGFVALEAGSAEVESGRDAQLDQTHANFRTLAQKLYYISKMDFVHKVYEGTSSSTKGEIEATYSNTLTR